jgi:hypothetical protein
MNGTCKCGKTYEACKYPVAHSHPTIDTIELPANIRAIGDKTPAQYTARDIAVLNEYRY